MLFQTQLSRSSLYLKILEHNFADLRAIAKKVRLTHQTGRSYSLQAAVGTKQIDLLVIEEARAAVEVHVIAGLSFEKEIQDCISIPHKQGEHLAVSFYGSRRVSLLK